ncbi:hypothetical protein Rcae01_04710 [Novipirellula caenicola]|uniref:Uncharacterized protein n=1 Tax=Novipirellula caenicola TaxID=1536901 RepID=A0ABP9VWY0_9BACT
MQHADATVTERQVDEIIDILAKAVVRHLTAHSNHLEKDSPKVSHVGLSSSANDRSL